MLFFHVWDATVKQLHYNHLQSAKNLSLASLGEERSFYFHPTYKSTLES